MSQQKKTELLRNFPDILKGLRLRKGLSQEALAQIIEVSPGAIANWESRQNAPSYASLGKIADKLGVSVEFLLGESAAEEPKTPAPRDHGGPYWGTSNRAPIVSWASAGQARAFIDQGPDVEHIATDCKDPNCYAIEVEGESMEPRYSKGDILVVTPQLLPVNGNLVVAKTTTDEVLFKLFHRAGANGENIRLTSYNPAYPPLEFHTQDFAFIHPVHSVLRRLR